LNIKQTNKKTIMKKSIALVALAFGVTGAFAQDLTSKKGEPFLPEAGDYAVSIDATSFLDYAGNFFGKQNKNNAPTWNFLNGNSTITGKYFKDATTAYRLGLRLNFGGNTEKSMVADRTVRDAVPSTNTYPNVNAMVENKWKQSNTNIGISVGLEKRKGKTRLQGLYGADLGIYVSSQRNKFTYGNALVANSSSATAPNVNVEGADGFAGYGNANLVSQANAPITGINAAGARLTDRKSGLTLSVGARAFIGAEYFVAPKVSIGGEFGWGLGFSMTGKSKSTWESVGTPSAAGSVATVGTAEVEGGKSSSFKFDTDGNNGVFGPNASLRLNLHF
jgi:hypothetical protein